MFPFHLCLSLTRCYNKTNGTFSSGTLPLMHRVAPCQQDGLEMVPLGQVSSQCRGHDNHTHSVDQEANAGYRSDEHKESSPSQHSCCLISNNETYLADNTGETRFSRKKSSFHVFCLPFLHLLTAPIMQLNSQVISKLLT